MRMMGNTDETEIHGISGSNFKFSGVRIERLGAAEYTLVNIAIDTTGSVRDFKDDLRKCLITVIESCKKSPRSENLLVRVFLFNASLPKGIQELHGFIPLADVDPNAYPDFNPGSTTNLLDAMFSAVGSTNAYAKQLFNSEFMSNGINIIITDGEDNASIMTAGQVKGEIEVGVKGEYIESVINILVGVNTANCRGYLEEIQKTVGIDKFIDAGDVTPGKLAKVAEFVSQSVSSQSQSLGTGGPSQQIAATI